MRFLLHLQWAFEVGGGGVDPPTLCFSRIEFIFSSLQPSLNLAMKVSALTFTSGLGQNIPVPPGAPRTTPPLRSRPPSASAAAAEPGDDGTSASSSSGSSGELHGELRALRSPTKSPPAANLNSGTRAGGGGIGIGGDRAPLPG